MLQVYQRMDHTHQAIDDSITLDYDSRQKARLKTLTDSGAQVAIFLERGHPLQLGEVLKSECGKLIEVKGALEEVITARTEDWMNFSKVCYHLGNRHTKIQIGERWLRFKTDHVLESLAVQYGLQIDTSPAVFEPQSGAYAVPHSHAH
jgi:urease accessory protein